MLIDIVIGLAIVLAFFSGYRKGIIFMLFFLVGIALGVAASLKLSYITASYLYHYFNIADEWMPILSFIVSFLIVFLIARFIAQILEKLLRTLQLNFINQFIGGILGAIIAYSILSIGFWYASNLNLLKPELTDTSMFYSYTMQTGPYLIEQSEKWLPYMKNLLNGLQDMFVNFADTEINSP